MMISPTELYFLLKLDAVRTFTLVVAIALVVFAVVSTMSNWFDDLPSIRRRWPLSAFIISAIFFFTYVATPSTKQMLEINIIPKVVNSEFVQEDVPKEAREVYAALKKWLMEQATETTGTEFDEKSVSYMKGYQLRKLIEESIRKEFEAQKKSAAEG